MAVAVDPIHRSATVVARVSKARGATINAQPLERTQNLTTTHIPETLSNS